MKGFHVFIIGAAILLAFGLAAEFLKDKAHFLLWLCDCRHPVLDYFFYYVTLAGEPHGFIFFGLMLWMISWRKMITIPSLGLIVTIVSFLLKEMFQYERPALYLNRIGWEGPMSVLGYYMPSGYHSFPSGHSMAAWALCTLVSAHIKKTGFSIFCLFLATSVSVSRVYLMAHFLQDVVVGAMIGIALGCGVYYLYIFWMRKVNARILSSAQPDNE